MAETSVYRYVLLKLGIAVYRCVNSAFTISKFTFTKKKIKVYSKSSKLNIMV